MQRRTIRRYYRLVVSRRRGAGTTWTFAGAGGRTRPERMVVADNLAIRTRQVESKSGLFLSCRVDARVNHNYYSAPLWHTLTPCQSRAALAKQPAPPSGG